jgi:hypothetical protein
MHRPYMGAGCHSVASRSRSHSGQGTSPTNDNTARRRAGTERSIVGRCGLAQKLLADGEDFFA